MMNYTPFMYSRMVDDIEKLEGGDTSPVTLKSEENALEKTEEVNTSGATPPISVSNVDNSQHLIKPDNSAKTMYRMFPMHHYRAMG